MHPLPPKKEVALALLERSSVSVHLDPRGEGVVVPAWFKKQPQLVLQIGLNMPVPIPDLRLDEAGMTCTLSFSRAPFYCVVPWSSVYALVGDDGRGMVWPEDIPPEVAQQAKEAAAKKPAPGARRPAIGIAPNPPARDESASASADPKRAVAAKDAADAKAPRDGKDPRESKDAVGKAKKPRKRARVVSDPQSAAGEARGALVAVPRAPRSEPAKVDGLDGRGPRPADSAPPTPRGPAPAASPPSAAIKPDGRKPPPGARPKRELPPYLRVVK